MSFMDNPITGINIDIDKGLFFKISSKSVETGDDNL